MIDRERFEQLAALAVAGEATGPEQAELDAVLEAEPALAAEFAELRDTERTLRGAVASRVSDVQMPAQALAMLEQARREALDAREVATVIPFPAAGKTRHFLRPWLALAAGLLILAGLALLFAPSRPSSKEIAVLAPRGVTGFTQPRFVWEARPGQRYDVWVLPAEGNHIEAPALFIAKDVQPPLDFAALQPAPALAAESRPTTRLEPGTDYRLLVCLAGAGRVAGVAVPFRTVLGATKAFPPPSLATARQFVAEDRPADALMVLTQLPPAERETAEAQALEKELRARLPKSSSSVSTPAP